MLFLTQSFSLYYAYHNCCRKVRQVIARVTELGQLYSLLMMKNDDEEIPLFAACKENDNGEIVEELLRYHSQEQLQSKNVIGDTPVHVSAFNGKLRYDHRLVTYILHQYFSLVSFLVYNRILESMYSKDRFCVTYVGRFGNLPIHAACAGRGHVDIDVVRKLLEWYEGVQTDKPSLTEVCINDMSV